MPDTTTGELMDNSLDNLYYNKSTKEIREAVKSWSMCDRNFILSNLRNPKIEMLYNTIQEKYAKTLRKQERKDTSLGEIG